MTAAWIAVVDHVARIGGCCYFGHLVGKATAHVVIAWRARRRRIEREADEVRARIMIDTMLTAALDGSSTAVRAAMRTPTGPSDG